MADNPKITKSPYKAMMQRNNDYCGYVSMNKLNPNKAYKMYEIKHTEHERYGSGELAFIMNNNQTKNRVQIPGKYLKEFTPDQIQGWYDDVAAKKYPLVVYRETLPDGSFKVDILPDGPQMQRYHNDWTDVPPLKDLNLQLDSSLESNSADADKDKDTEDENPNLISNPMKRKGEKDNSSLKVKKHKGIEQN